MKKVLLVVLIIIVLFGWNWFDIQKGRSEAPDAWQSPIHYANFRSFTTGHDFYDALFSDVRTAKKYIYIHFFIIRNDKISHQFLDLLKEKSKLGVEVKLSVDRFASYEMTKSMVEGLRKAGVEFTYSGMPAFHHFFYTLENRNHRRMIVIDGMTAYTGGFNIGKEHLDKEKRLGHWADFHFRISGDGAVEMEKQFLRDWKKDTGKSVAVHTDSNRKGTTRYQYFFADGKGLAEKYADFIGESRKSIVIATPYFIPGKTVTSALVAARKRGVSLTILVPNKIDIHFIKEASYPYLREVLAAGAKIYFYQDGFFHGKVMVIDGKTVLTGSANLDYRSLFLNDESQCFIYGSPFVGEIQKQLNADFQKSQRITDSYFKKLGLWDRFLEKMISVFAYFL